MGGWGQVQVLQEHMLLPIGMQSTDMHMHRSVIILWSSVVVCCLRKISQQHVFDVDCGCGSCVAYFYSDLAM